MLTIEKNIAIPPRKNGAKPGWSRSTKELADTIKQMCIGDSIVLTLASRATLAGKLTKILIQRKELSEDIIIVSRTQEDGTTRIWKTIRECER